MAEKKNLTVLLNEQSHQVLGRLEDLKHYVLVVTKLQLMRGYDYRDRRGCLHLVVATSFPSEREAGCNDQV